ncbi:MAG: twin-arginine translocase subunit TatC [bacterium]
MNQYVKDYTKFKTEITHFFVVFVLASTVILVFSRQLIKILLMQVPFTINFVQLTPAEIFLSSLKIAVLTGFYLSFPVIIYYLKKFNKKILFTSLMSGFLLFAAGILFAYYVAIPLLLLFLLGFNSNLAHINISISSYVSFCLQVILIIGMAFELPVFCILLVKTRFISSKKLISLWKYVFIGALAVSFIIASSLELFAQIMFAGIILFFYGICIAITKIYKK